MAFEQLAGLGEESSLAFDRFSAELCGEIRQVAGFDTALARASEALRPLSRNALGILAMRVMVDLLVLRGELVLAPEVTQELMRRRVSAAADSEDGDDQ